MFRLQDYLDKETIERDLSLYPNDNFDEMQLFKNAFGYDYEKYYIPFVSAEFQNLDDIYSLAEFYISAISSIEYECGEIEYLKNENNSGDINCYNNGKLIATVNPYTSELYIVI